MRKTMNFRDVAIVYVKGSTYRIFFWYISKDDAISIINNSNLIHKKGVCNFLLIYKKWVSATPLNATPLKKLTIKKTKMWYKRAKRLSQKW